VLGQSRGVIYEVYCGGLEEHTNKTRRAKELLKAIFNQKQLTLNCSNITELREIKIPAFERGEGWSKGMEIHNLLRQLCNDSKLLK